jgi:hypothetical protein
LRIAGTSSMHEALGMIPSTEKKKKKCKAGKLLACLCMYICVYVCMNLSICLFVFFCLFYHYSNQVEETVNSSISTREVGGAGK